MMAMAGTSGTTAAISASQLKRDASSDEVLPWDQTERSVLIIDDHPLYCEALTFALETLLNRPTIQTAACLADALALIADDFSPDLIMLDLNLPDTEGVSGFFRLKGKVPNVPVLVISATTSATVVQTLLSAGVAGYVPKDAPRETIKQALQEIWQGRTYVPSIYNYSDALPSAGQQAVSPDATVKVELEQAIRRFASLTPQQNKILDLVCQGKLNKQIAYELSLAESTVKAHVSAMFKRLNVRNRTQAAVLVKQIMAEISSSQ